MKHLMFFTNTGAIPTFTNIFVFANSGPVRMFTKYTLIYSDFNILMAYYFLKISSLCFITSLCGCQGFQLLSLYQVSVYKK